MGTGARAPVFVEFRTTGIEGVRSGLRLVRDEGEQGSEKMARSTQRVAGAISEIAHAGEAGQRSIKELITSGAEMALTFGAGGPILGAIGLLGLTFYNVFNRAREEMKKTRETAIEELERIASNADLGEAAKYQQNIYSGNPNAIRHVDESDLDFMKRRYGLQGVNARVEQLNRGLADHPDVVKYVTEHGRYFGSMGYGAAVDQQAKELAKLLPIQREMNEQFQAAQRITQELTKAEVARTSAKIAADKTTNAPKELADEIANLKALADIHRLTAPDVARAAALQKQFTEQLVHGNPSLKERVQLERDLATVTAIAKTKLEIPTLTMPGVRNPLGTNIVNTITGVKASDITKGFWDIWAEGYNAFLDRLPQMVAGGLADALSAGLVAGITTGFQKGANIGNAGAAFAGAVLHTIGGIAIQIGTSTLMLSQFMQTIMTAIASLNPIVGIAASLGLIAFGAVLEGLGSRVGSSGSIGGGGGSFAGMNGMPQIIDRGFINTTSSAARGVAPRDSVVNQNFIIGTDPKAWRQVQGQLDANAARSGRKL